MIAASLALLALQPAPSPPDLEPAFETLVVTAPREPLAPLPDAIAHFRRYCHEAVRRNGTAALPGADDSDWLPLDSTERGTLRLEPALRAAALDDPARGHRLILTAGEGRRADGLFEARCSLIVIGGRAHDGLAGDAARLFGGPGTRRHVDHVDGTPALPGWSHLIWTAMPQRGSASWRPPGGRRGRDSFLVVTDERFYDRHDYVLGDLKRSEDRPVAVSILSLAVVTRR